MIKYSILCLVALFLLISCDGEKLELNPTSSMSGSSLMGSATTALVPLNGIYRSMYGDNNDETFGPMSFNFMNDCMAEDMVMGQGGSGWFEWDVLYRFKNYFTSTNERCYHLWSTHYSWIANTNYILAAQETMQGDTKDVNYVMGQAYAIRAYSYFMLAQYFARTYKGHESEPCVPIYTEPTSADTKGHARSSVQEVYDLINADIAKAVEYLERSQKTSLDKDKSFITYPVALGLQARIALTQEDWNTAAKAAEAVINMKKYTIQPVSPAAFAVNNGNFINTVSSGNVMWGASIIADQSGMYASLYAHMEAEANMYAGYDRAPKTINIDTYNLMGPADTRRCWWNPADETMPYLQEKFHFSTLSTYLGDYVWMRIEEMYLMAAEAECMLGHDAQAQQYLNTMVQTRDPEYNCDKTGTRLGKLTSDRTGSLREAIIDQRRIELWGEYGRIYDIRRLKQGFKRDPKQGWPNSPRPSSMEMRILTPIRTRTPLVIRKTN